VAAWGLDDRGQLSVSPPGGSFSLRPVLASLPPRTRITQVVAGCNHSLALTSTGSVLSWGDNSKGELGDGDTGGFSVSVVQVRLPSGVTVRAIAAGCQYSLALTTDGQLLAWGANSKGQLGTGRAGGNAVRPVPTRLPSGVKVRAVAAGQDHVLALSTTGKMYAWGGNDTAQLGNGTSGKPGPSPTPVPLMAGTRVTAVAAGQGDSMVVTGRGQVLGWGEQGFGELGDGRDGRPVRHPVRALLPAGTRVRGLTTSCEHTLALTTSGSVLAWGFNGEGMLGIGNARKTESKVPVRVHVPHGLRVAAVGGGCLHNLVLTTHGQVLAWGSGPLGNGKTQPRSVPVRVQLPAGRAAVALGAASEGYNFSLALLR
jgi:alpha-tubulin suppressor-like RCC1 family protein